MIRQWLTSFLSSKKTTITALAISLVLLVVSAGINYRQDKKTQELEAKLNTNAIQYGRLQERRQAQNDSLAYYRKELVRIQKLIVVQELTLKRPPDEKEILLRFSQMPDSTAIRIFSQRYGANGLFAGSTGR